MIPKHKRIWVNTQKDTPKCIALAVCALLLSGCSVNLPTPAALPQTTAAILTSNTNATVIPGTPAEIYQRIARNASTCWFGPFGSAYRDLMTSADAPPASANAPVSMSVHRRLKDLKKPWGPALMRLLLSGETTTSLEFQNIGLDRPTFDQMTIGFTRWANGSSVCEPLKKQDPMWQPVANAPHSIDRPK